MHYPVGVENTICTEYWVEAKSPEDAEVQAARLANAEVPRTDLQRIEVLETCEEV